MKKTSEISCSRSVVHAAVLVLGLILLSRCNTTQFLSEGQSFYEGAEIEFDQRSRGGGRKSVREELEEYLVPAPTGKFLGMRPQVWFYYKGNPEKKKGFRNFLKKKLGKEPVLLSDVEPERVAKSLAGQLNNEGYFGSEVTSEVVTKDKESKVIYTVLLHPPYRLKDISYPKPKDSVYARILRTLYEGSLLETKQRYDLEVLKAEQARIEEVVENFGLYYFDDRYLIFEADSTVGEKQIDIELHLEPNIPRKARRIFRLNEVTIFPHHTLDADTTKNLGDTLKVNRFNYIKQSTNFRPGVITNVINLRKGDVYSREAQQLTLSHLMDLGVFKFVNIKFRDVSADSALLNSNIYLTPLKKKSLRAEMQMVSKSNNFVGPGITLTYTDRNVFKGAELFELSLNSSYEVQYSGNSAEPLNAFELGIEGKLTVPRFISPIRIDYSSKRFLPKTQFTLSTNLQNRIGFYRLNSFRAAYGYNWRESLSKAHELLPVNITYVRTDKQSPEFEELLDDNSLLQASFEDQFIIGSRYSYTLNTQLAQDPAQAFQEKKFKTHNFYFNANLDVAGNLLNAIQNQAKKGEEGPFELFGSPYSQFVRADFDFRYYWQPDEHNKLVGRISNGAGYAYGNATTLPYILQYAVGGSNSIRAFPARSVGPGTYNVRTDPEREQDSVFFIDQRGDIKIEANLEYRFDMVKFLKGALFVDAGNVWTWREDEREGGKFQKEDFFKELAVGAGFGLRFDFSFFVLRFDTAIPIRRPDREPGNRWVFDEIDFGSSEWRDENIIFNIAIGYPF